MTLTKFVNRFFDNIAKFHGPARHPKWRDINLGATFRVGPVSSRRSNGSTRMQSVRHGPATTT